MNILELDSYNLADTVKFHDRLNPRLWDSGEHLRPEVKAKLLEIAQDFQEFLGVPDLDVKDITISGSNAAFNYTTNSDIDLHVVVDVPSVDDEVYRELFNAKKYQYNDEHDIRIRGADVELYAQDSRLPHHSQGIYSLMHDKWLSVPKRTKADIDDVSTRSKFEDLAARIDDTVKTQNVARMDSLMKKIKTMRQTGLEKQGEFGSDNLAFKLLRNNGYIKKLIDAKKAARDHELSLAELAKPKQRIRYGFSESPDGVDPTTKMFLEEPTDESPDGVNPTTAMFLTETNPESIVDEFIQHTADKLGINRMPKIFIHHDEDWSKENHSFGMYVPERHELHVSLGNRHLLDILRTTAHELCHCAQHEQEPLPPHAGNTGSDWENEAHAVAGIIMRDFADTHPGYFKMAPVKESASGYIPKNKKEARDPRYSMALTVDIKPGQVGKEANKLALDTGRNGEPALLMKTANLQESLARELELFEEQDLFEVKMTSKNLANLAKDIKGAKVGLEFEMIVPNVSNDEDSDQEPDYDQDERVRDIDDAVNFFDDGDYNDRGSIRRLREQMESDYFNWQTEQIDQDWADNGFEFFMEYMDREEPFDPTDYEDRAEDEVKADYPDLDPTSEEFEELKSEKLREINAEYYNETWQMEGRGYDNAREEFEDEKRDEYTESAWLDDRGIRYASDVQNEFSDIQWPYWSSVDGGESDIESVALDFMNAMGMDTVAISSSYHGSYKKWVGNGWVSIGSNKPDDCFTIEPDGSLEGDDRTDTGLEFVSPPIPLEDIGTVMKKVQRWAGLYGAYTGDQNKTSIHTNISIPGYNLDNLDYLKAALLLGDEYVLREFDRIGNSYAAPAIEKVKALVKQNPDKAQALLDKMKSQLNAEASKLIHSGQTNKFTSINTKDNRVEFRSPGGDYLSIIADNPQKMVDTINRMVVTLDAAMDPNKYKEEYQKKLYKLLTGQGGGREAKTGAKQEMKKDDKDLLNIFSRYAAGELPKAALKSFVRQAQLQRSIERDPNKGKGKWWWNVAIDGQRVEVVANDSFGAWQAAIDTNPEWMRFNRANAEIKPLRPYEEKPEAQQPAQQDNRTYRITSTGGALIAGDEYGDDQTALQRAQYWAQRRGVDVIVRNPQGEEVGRVSAFGEITPAAQQSTRGVPRWEIVNNATGDVVQVFTGGTEDAAADYALNTYGHRFTFTTRPSDGEIQRVGDQIPNYYIKNRDTDEIVKGYFADDSSAAHEYLTQWKRDNNLADADYVYGRVSALPDAVQRNIVGNRPAATGPAQNQEGNWGIWLTSSDRFVRAPNQLDNSVLRRFPSREAAEQFLAQTRSERADMRTDIEVREIEPATPVPGPTLDLQRQRAAAQPSDAFVSTDTVPREGRPLNLVPAGPGPWEIYRISNGETVRALDHTNRPAAEEEARSALGLRGEAPELYGVRTRQSDAAQGGIVDVAGEPPATAPQTLTRPGQGQQVFTGEWKIVDPQGRIIYSFGGVGNAQADANRVAMDWLMRNRQHMQNGVEVLPIMGQA